MTQVSASQSLVPHFSQTPRESDGPVVRPQSVTNDGCPISARFWQMWDSTAVHRSLSWQQVLMSIVIYTLYSQEPRFVESHICQNRADMGHPSFVADPAVKPVAPTACRGGTGGMKKWRAVQP